MNTKRLTLLKLNQSHKDDIQKLYQNNKVRKYLWWIKTTIEFDLIFKEFLNCDISEHYWSLQEIKSHQIIWLFSLTKYHSEDKFEISYQLDSNYWWKGYAFEAINTIIEFVFNEYNLSIVYAETQEKNKPSVWLLQKVWMNLDWKLVRHWESQLVFSLTKRDYFNSKL